MQIFHKKLPKESLVMCVISLIWSHHQQRHHNMQSKALSLLKRLMIK